jgi:hypothetical protein
MKMSGQFQVRPLHPRETAPGIHWIGGWMGPRARLDAMEKRKIVPLPGIQPRPSSLYHVAISTELVKIKRIFKRQ